MCLPVSAGRSNNIFLVTIRSHSRTPTSIYERLDMKRVRGTDSQLESISMFKEGDGNGETE